MKKIIKRLIILAVIAALVGGGIFASLKFRDSKKATIDVYPVTDLAEEDYWEDAAETYGTVKSDRVQAVYLSTSQKVEEVKVKEGQQVKKGDVLMTYDTTLSKVEVDRSKLALQKLQEDMKKYQSDLEKVKKYRPGVPVAEKDQVDVGEGYESDGGADDIEDGEEDGDDELKGMPDGTMMVLSAGGSDSGEGEGEPEQSEGNPDQEAADAVSKMIEELPDSDDPGFKEAVENAREAYDALSETQQDLVTNYDLLEKAEEDLKKAEQDAADQAAADEVIEKINNLPDDITLDNENAINEAREAYNNLTEEQQALVTNENKLKKAEEDLASLQNQPDQGDDSGQEAVNAVIEKIEGLPEDITLADEAAVKEAREAYDSLTPDQKALVTNYDVLLAAETDLVIRLIDDLSDPIKYEDKEKVEEAREAYDSLTEDQQGAVSNYNKLTAAEDDLKAAADVDKMIANLPDQEKITEKDSEAVDAARKAYNALSDHQKTLVQNLAKLREAEDALKGWPERKEGKGTEQSPFVYEWNSKCTLSQAFLEYVSDSRKDAYVTFQVMDKAEKDVVTEWTIHVRTLVTNNETSAFIDETEADAKNNPAADYNEEYASDMVKSSFSKPYIAYDFVKKNATEYETTTEAPTTTQAPETPAPTEPTETTPTESSGESETESSTAEQTSAEETSAEETKESTTAEEDDPDDPDDPDFPDGPDDDDDGTSVTYTANEIAEMRNTLEASLRDLDLDIRMAQLEIRQKEMELNNGEVTSEIDGTVRTLRDAEQSQIDRQAFIEIVGGGGGYYISSTVGELDLDTVKVGQPINVMSYETGATSVGEVSEISTYPVSGQYYDGSGNSNVSYYPFKVFVKDDATFQNGEFVQLTYDDTYEEDSDSFYLMNSMMRTENGKTYVYVRDKNGQLKQQTIKTGKIIWGSYTEVMSGLSLDDWVAFPYGKDVKEGCPTKEAETDALWEGAY